MSGVARDRVPDATLALLRDGYEFISQRCTKLGADAFETRLLGRKTVCCRGAEAARLFYDARRLQRQGAMPSPVRKTLVGVGGVQGLDGGAHRARKRMLMSLMKASRIAALADETERQWRAETRRWLPGQPVVFFDRAQAVLCRGVCRWSGVPLPEDAAAHRTTELAALIDGSGTLGARHWRARRARRRSEAWLAGLVRQTRAGELTPAPETALAVIAGHRDHAGRLLKERVAAVELLNVLRPTVAISTFLTFAMLALHRFPETRGGVTEGRPRPLEGTFLEAFVHEVRRYYPFFPFAAARACREFVWRDHRFPLGRLVLLDLYGTNRDPALWQDPADFMPSRFLARKPGPYTFIPQGGGDYYAHHRCAGEWITVELMKRSLRFLVAEVPWEVPPQDLSIDLRRMPTRPASGFILTRR